MQIFTVIVFDHTRTRNDLGYPLLTELSSLYTILNEVLTSPELRNGVAPLIRVRIRTNLFTPKRVGNIEPAYVQCTIKSQLVWLYLLWLYNLQIRKARWIPEHATVLSYYAIAIYGE